MLLPLPFEDDESVADLLSEPCDVSVVAVEEAADQEKSVKFPAEEVREELEVDDDEVCERAVDAGLPRAGRWCGL